MRRLTQLVGAKAGKLELREGYGGGTAVRVTAAALETECSDRTEAGLARSVASVTGCRGLVRGAPGFTPGRKGFARLGRDFVDNDLYRGAGLYLDRRHTALEVAALRHGVSGFGYAGADGNCVEIR